MRLLDRYVLRELLVPLGYCLSGFLVIWIAWDLISEMSEFQSRRLKGIDVAQYYLIRVPEVLAWPVLPIAVLLAVLYAITNHARHHELTAMRAAGVSLWRIAVPYFALTLALGAGMFALNELWVPKATDRAQRVLMRYQPVTDQAGPDIHSNLYFRNERERRSWRADLYNQRTHTMRGVNVQWDREDGSWVDLYAETATWAGSVWVFQDVKQLSYGSRRAVQPSVEMFEARQFAFSETPDLIRSEIKINSLSSFEAAKRAQLSIREILDYLRLHPTVAPAQAAMLETQLHGRLALPWTYLVVVLIALPFGAPSGRRNVFVGVAASIFICFLYFVVHRLSLTLGTSGHVPGWVAAWTPNAVFAFVGSALIFRVR